MVLLRRQPSMMPSSNKIRSKNMEHADECRPMTQPSDKAACSRESVEPEMSFEERWSHLLDDCRQTLLALAKTPDRDSQVRDLWTQLNKFVTIMAIPDGVKSSLRSTLWQMARKSSFKQSVTLCFYALLTFLPRHTYRNIDTQKWFKQRLTNPKN